MQEVVSSSQDEQQRGDEWEPYFRDNHIGWLGDYEELKGAKVPGESSRGWRAWQSHAIRS